MLYPSGTTTSYSIGTDACNIGTAPLNWIELAAEHPTISQNVYRLKNGRIEQLGQSWLKHSFCALQGTTCSACTPFCGGCCDHLGVGCSDPYTAQRNGGQARLGPKSEVNVFTGVYPWPHGARNVVGDILYKRIQIPNADLDPALNAGALYFGEGQYVTHDDATALNNFNNGSYKRLVVGAFAGAPPGYTITFTGTTARQKSAIQAWKDHGLGLNTPDPNVFIVNVNVPAEGRFFLGYKVTDLGGGQWHYEYAIQNLNSHRSGGSFSVPLAAGVVVSNVEFHDVNYHSGEPYANTDWPSNVGGGAVAWSSPQTFVQNPNSNALRWGTLYNFRFDANVAPVSGNVTLGLFRTGTPSEVIATASIPGTPPPPECACDYNDSNTLDSQDFFDFLAGFFASDPAADFNNSGTVDSQDFFDFLACFFTPPAGC
jgi:hypothetical protein